MHVNNFTFNRTGSHLRPRLRLPHRLHLPLYPLQPSRRRRTCRPTPLSRPSPTCTSVPACSHHRQVPVEHTLHFLPIPVTTTSATLHLPHLCDNRTPLVCHRPLSRVCRATSTRPSVRREEARSTIGCEACQSEVEVPHRGTAPSALRRPLRASWPTSTPRRLPIPPLPTPANSRDRPSSSPRPRLNYKRFTLPSSPLPLPRRATRWCPHLHLRRPSVLPYQPLATPEAGNEYLVLLEDRHQVKERRRRGSSSQAWEQERSEEVRRARVGAGRAALKVAEKDENAM